MKFNPVIATVLAAYANVGERLMILGLGTIVKTVELELEVTELGLFMLMRILQAPSAAWVPTTNVNEFESIIVHGFDVKKLAPSALTSAVQSKPGIKFVPVTVMRLFLYARA